MNKLIYRVIRKILTKATFKGKARKVYFGPLRGKSWVYDSGYSQYFMGDYEREVVDVFYEYAKKSKFIYDIGANVGYYTLISAKAVEKNNGMVYALEPLPGNLLLLQKNVDANLNRNIKILDYAISDSTGTALFSNSENNVANTLSVSSPTFKSNDSIQVKTITLDELVEKKIGLPPDLLKIDVEGSELEALRGSEKVLKKYRPVIFLSTHNCHIPGVHKKCIDYLKTIGYKIKYLNFRENKTENDDLWYEVLAEYNSI